MTRYRLIFTTLLAACSLGDELPEDKDGPTKPPTDTETGDIVFQSAVDAAVGSGLPGAVVAVRVGDKRFAAAAGLANLEIQRPMRVSDPFRVASNSKSMLGVAFAQLDDEGDIDLDDLASDHLPADLVAQVANADVATIRQLLNHTSGVPQFADQEFFIRSLEDPNRGWSTQDALEHVFGKPADFAPGEGWNYSNTNYLLAGLILDEHIGAHHSEELRWRIFDELPLTSAYYERHEPAKGDLVRGYIELDENPGLDDATDIDVGIGLAAGPVVSTIPDLADYIYAFSNDLMSTGATIEMYQVVDTGEGTDYGLGITVSKDGREHFHSGGLPGFATMMMSVPASDIAIAVGVNSDEPAFGDAIEELFSATLARATELSNTRPRAIPTTVVRQAVSRALR